MRAADDPLYRMYRDVELCRAFVNNPRIGATEGDAATARIGVLEDMALTANAETPAGAIAALEWASREFREFYASEPGNAGDVLILALMTSALTFLRSLDS